jgi:hypothetical protein
VASSSGSTAADGTARTSALRLAGYSFLILFLELALIRYVAAYVRVFGFYVNFVLIATFLGMGVGLLRSAAAQKLKLIGPVVLVALLGLVKIFATTSIRVNPDEHEALWSIFPHVSGEIAIVPAVLMLFTLCTLLFVPLGALMGAEFRKFRPLIAYSFDIGGSLAGVIVFGIMSALHTVPLTWFAIALVVWFALSLDDKRFLAALAPLGAAALVLAARTAAPQGEYWSPYYRITTDHRTNLTRVRVNGALHQYMVNFAAAGDTGRDALGAFIAQTKSAYLLPYSFVPSVDTALVVGAGTGNDVALLLGLGAKYIDAVEIDPTIYMLGKSEHFMHPYDDPRVHVHIDDARAFLRRSPQHYDVITMGTLDSQTLLSGMSSVRLDNYVYTVESMQSARDHLKPDGSLIAYHLSPRPYIAAKVYQIIAVAFGQPPRAIRQDSGLFNLTVIAGAGAAGAKLLPKDSLLLSEVTLPHDDWPYLYLSEPTIPAHYLTALAGVLLIAVALIGIAGWGELRRRERQDADGRGDLALFAMGVGFLLLESKSVTEMSLLFGSTWNVNLLVFGSILVVIGGANAIVMRLQRSALTRLFIGLFAALALAYAIPARSLLGLGMAGQWALGGLLVALPIFFAAAIFALLLRDRADATRGLACNLLGAIVGGVLEYSAMVVGIKALYLIAGAAYLCAMVAALAPAVAPAPSPAAEPAA